MMYNYMRKLLFAVIIGSLALGITIPASASLYDYYGGDLPSVSERAQLAVDAGIVSDPTEYTGSYSQNLALEAYLSDQRTSEGLGSLLGATQRPSGYQVSLAESLSANASTTEDIKVSSLRTKDGHTLTDSDVGDFIILTIAPGRGNEEKILCTGGTSTSTNEWQTCTRGYNYYNQAAGTATVYPHTPGELVIISDDDAFIASQIPLLDGTNTYSGTNNFYNLPTSSSTATLYNQLFNFGQATSTFVDFSSAQTISGGKLFTASSTFTNSVQVPYSSASSSAASVGYVSDVAFNGSPNASTTVKGISQEATVAQINAGTADGSTGARLYINPQTLSYSNYASTSAITVHVSKPLVFGSMRTDSIAAVSSSTAWAYEWNLPSVMAINKISFWVTAVSVSGGKFSVGVYSQDGQQLYFSTTSSAVTTTGTKSATLTSPVSLVPGNYYVVVVANGNVGDFDVRSYTTSNGDIRSVSGEPVLEGTITVTPGTLPATFNPLSDITDANNKSYQVRFDN